MFGAQRGIRTPKSSGFEPVVCANLTKPAGQFILGASGGTRTLTPFGTWTSTMRVCHSATEAI